MREEAEVFNPVGEESEEEDEAATDVEEAEAEEASAEWRLCEACCGLGRCVWCCMDSFKLLSRLSEIFCCSCDC